MYLLLMVAKFLGIIGSLQIRYVNFCTHQVIDTRIYVLLSERKTLAEASALRITRYCVQGYRVIATEFACSFVRPV